jgi:hypothetical protein
MFHGIKQNIPPNLLIFSMDTSQENILVANLMERKYTRCIGTIDRTISISVRKKW